MYVVVCRYILEGRDVYLSVCPIYNSLILSPHTLPFSLISLSLSPSSLSLPLAPKQSEDVDEEDSEQEDSSVHSSSVRSDSSGRVKKNKRGRPTKKKKKSKGNAPNTVYIF